MESFVFLERIIQAPSPYPRSATEDDQFSQIQAHVCIYNDTIINPKHICKGANLKHAHEVINHW